MNDVDELAAFDELCAASECDDEQITKLLEGVNDATFSQH